MAAGEEVTSSMPNGWTRVDCSGANDARGTICTMSVLTPQTVVPRSGKSTLPTLSHTVVTESR